MAGTKSGGEKAAATNKIEHGEDYYRRIGQKGGKKSRRGGFGSGKVGLDGLTGPERARIAGKNGGESFPAKEQK